MSYYKTLKKLEELFRSSNFLNIESDEDALCAFSSVYSRSNENSKEIKKKAILGAVPIDILTQHAYESQTNNERKSEQSSSKKNYYINENGFIFKKELQSIEDDYKDSSLKIRKEIEEAISKYRKMEYILNLEFSSCWRQTMKNGVTNI